MQRIALVLAIAASPAVLPRVAGAQPDTTDDPPAVSAEAQPARVWSFGARVGGYGFRNQHQEGRRNNWDDCRMNGFGIFGERRFGGHLFVEGGADLYFSESFPLELAEGEDDMDRVSGLITAAVGLRMFPTSRVSGYAQLGGGVELTRIKMGRSGALASEDSAAHPAGFIGIGGDVRLGSRFRLGMNLRAYVMAHYTHGPSDEIARKRDGEHDPVTAPSLDLEVEPEAVAQLQFYLKYDL